MNRSVLQAAFAAAVCTTLTLAAVPAMAEPVDGYNELHVYTEALGDRAAVQDAEYGGIFVPLGDSHHVTLEIRGWKLDFVAPSGRRLLAGETFEEARSEAVPDGGATGLKVTESQHFCDGYEDDSRVAEAIGYFTVREAEYDSSDRVRRFSAVFEQNCQDTSVPALRGSVTASARTAPAPVPAPSPAPGPVTDVRTQNNNPFTTNPLYNITTITWRNPTDPEWWQTVVTAHEPSVPCTKVGKKCPAGLTYVGRGTTATDDPEGSGDETGWRLNAISRTGRISPTTTALVTGVWLGLDVAPRVVMGTPTWIGGSLNERTTNALGFYTPGAGIGGLPVEIYSRPKASDTNAYAWRLLARVTTRPDGSYGVVDTPMVNTLYMSILRGTPTYIGDASFNRTLPVAPMVDLMGQRKGRKHAKLRFTTMRSTAGSRGFVRLQQYRNRSWHTVMTKRLRAAQTSRAGRVIIRFRPKVRGQLLFRLAKPGDARHVTGYSRTVRVKVR